jgi:hypothetical protein
MKYLLSIVMLFLSLMTITSHAQTTKKTPAPVKKTVAKKPMVKKPTEQEKAAKAAAIAKAKEDSAAAVHALAMKLARQIVVEDSIKKAQAAEQLAAEEKLKNEQLLANKQKKPERTVKEKQTKEPKAKREKVAATKPEKKPKAPVKEAQDDLKRREKPAIASTETKAWIGLRALGVGSFLLNEDATDPYMGYGGGVVANFALGKHFSFQPEVLYTQQGYTYKSAERKISKFANMIQVPLLLKYSFGASNRGLFVNVGPYGNYVINGVVKYGSEKQTIKPEKTIIDYGVAAGLGVAVPLGRGRLLIEARGTYYLGTTEDTTDETKFATGAVSVGYLIPIGK